MDETPIFVAKLDLVISDTYIKSPQQIRGISDTTNSSIATIIGMAIGRMRRRRIARPRGALKVPSVGREKVAVEPNRQLPSEKEIRTQREILRNYNSFVSQIGLGKQAKEYDTLRRKLVEQYKESVGGRGLKRKDFDYIDSQIREKMGGRFPQRPTQEKQVDVVTPSPNIENKSYFQPQVTKQVPSPFRQPEPVKWNNYDYEPTAFTGEQQAQSKKFGRSVRYTKTPEVVKPTEEKYSHKITQEQRAAAQVKGLTPEQKTQRQTIRDIQRKRGTDLNRTPLDFEVAGFKERPSAFDKELPTLSLEQLKAKQQEVLAQNSSLEQSLKLVKIHEQIRKVDPSHQQPTVRNDDTTKVIPQVPTQAAKKAEHEGSASLRKEILGKVAGGKTTIPTIADAIRDNEKTISNTGKLMDELLEKGIVQKTTLPTNQEASIDDYIRKMTEDDNDPGTRHIENTRR